MWDSVLRTFRETLDKAEATYLTKAKSMVLGILSDGIFSPLS